MTTVTQPALYFDYLLEQIGLLIKNHGVPVEIGESDMHIPLHFSFGDGQYVEEEYSDRRLGDSLRDHFDVPELAVTDYATVNGTWQGKHGEPQPRPAFTTQHAYLSAQHRPHQQATPTSHIRNT